MKIDTRCRHITPADGNVFADLGFDPDEAAMLKANSQKIIATKIAIKNTLMAEVIEWVERKNLSQVDAANILGVSRAQVSDVLKQKAVEFTIDTLVEMVLRTGKSIQVVLQG